MAVIFMNKSTKKQDYKEMPTIRISEDHAKRLEKLAVEKTVEQQKIVTIAKALEELLEKELPKNKN